MVWSVSKNRGSVSSDASSMGVCEVPSPRTILAIRSRLRGATHIDAGAVASGDLRIDIAQHHHAAVEGDDLAVVIGAAGAMRADIVLPARPALEPEFLHLRLVGWIHHHPAGRALPDHEGMGALALGGRLGAGAILWPVERGIAPAPDHLGGADAGGNFRCGGRLDWDRLGRGRRAAEAPKAAETTAAGQHEGQQGHGGRATGAPLSRAQLSPRAQFSGAQLSHGVYPSSKPR